MPCLAVAKLLMGSSVPDPARSQEQQLLPTSQADDVPATCSLL